jgi:hypothetical protein
MRNSIDKKSPGRGKYQLLACLFLLFYFIVGMSIYRDYGLSADELPQQRIGAMSWKYVLSGNFSYTPSFRNKDYGPAFEMFLTGMERLLKLQDSREIFFMRHLINFLLFFVSVWVFHLLCRYHFGDHKIALLGALFLILSPRIFADSFYNSKDLPFLSMCIISMYTLVRLSQERSFLTAAAHGLSCALLIDIRIPGVVLVVITLFSLGSDLIGSRTDHQRSSKTVKLIFVYLAVLIPSVIAFWPYLWHNPVNNFIDAFMSMSRFHRWRGFVLYFGDHIKGTELPWHYVPLWIMITTPLLYVFAFFVGLCVFLSGFLRKPINYLSGDQTYRRQMLFFLCFFLPLSAVIAFKSVLYNGWRQMFFIYPAFLLISLSGIASILRFIRAGTKAGARIYQYLLVSIIVVSVSSTAYSMIRDHPYQNVYFNELVSKEEGYLASHFDLDYWGLSYRKALEYIVSIDNEKVINIHVEDAIGKRNASLLDESQRERLQFVETPEEAKYYLTHNTDEDEICPGNEEFYSVKVHGSKIMVVCKLR